MARRPANITQADVTRAIRAAKQAGAAEVEVRIGRRDVSSRRPQERSRPLKNPRRLFCDGRYATPTAAALASPNDSAWPGRLVRAHEPGIACPDSRRVWIAGVLGRVSCGHIRRVAAAEESCGCGIARLADRALSRDHGM